MATTPKTHPTTVSEGDTGIDSRDIFRPIVPVYDVLNRILSLGLDQSWRRAAAREARGDLVLDLATGTGDLAFELARDRRVVAADILPEMVLLARAKAGNKKAEAVRFCSGAGEDIPFKSETFDSLTIAFGIRNFRNRLIGLSEMARVLKPGGRLVILEFGVPEGRIFGTLYRFYFQKVLPLIGRVFSGNNRSYTYLPESVLAWPSPDDFASEILERGFEDVKHRPLTFGICRLFTATKEDS